MRSQQVGLLPDLLETLKPLDHLQKVLQCKSWFPDIIEGTIINVYFEALPCILSNLCPNIPLIAPLPLEYNRLEYHEGYYPLEQATCFEWLMLAAMVLES